MSNARFSIIQAKAVRDTRITNSQFRTLSALGIYGDEDGWCYPKLATLADDLGKSPQAVSRDIQALCTLGYVEKHPQFREDGSQKHNLYRLLFDTPPQHHVEPPSTSEVEPPSTSEVEALTTHINDPIERINNHNGEPTPSPFGEIVKTWENIRGSVTRFDYENLKAMWDEWEQHTNNLPKDHPDKQADPFTVLHNALTITGKKAENPTLAYTESILKDWRARGVAASKPGRNGRRSSKKKLTEQEKADLYANFFDN